MAKSIELKSKVLELRSRGYSIKELAKQFNISKSTVSVWTRDIKLSNSARARLLSRIKFGQYISGQIKKERTDKLKRSLTHQAVKDVASLKHNDLTAKVLCAIIYWCEGNKQDNSVRFTNSDPYLVRCFMDLLVKHFQVSRKKFKARIHLHGYHDSAVQTKFWSQKLNISTGQFDKPYLKPNTRKRIRENYPGCINICYYDTIVARKLLYLAKAFLSLDKF